MVEGQSVTIATNQVMSLLAFAFAIGAAVIWCAPRPKHAVDMTQAGH